MASNLQIVKRILSTDEMKKRFKEIMGEKAPQFMASITNAVSGTPALQECDPNSVMSAALVAATLDLPIDSNLGFAAIVPYNGKAQFQIMYRGFIQLAIRSGYYEKMNYSEVYEDELVSYNPITGEVIFVDDFSKCTQRRNGQTDKIIGYFAWFRLSTGFSKELFMSTSEVENHARKYSKAYQYDIKKGKKSSLWSSDFDSMAKKTVIKRLLSKWGILSIDMQKAIQDDQKVYDGENGLYIDNGDEPKDAVIDAFANPAAPGPEADRKDDSEGSGQEETASEAEDDYAAFDAQYADDSGLPWNQ